jgi:hypothetical protein
MRDLKLEQELTLLRSLMSEAKAFRDIIQATLNMEVVVPEHENRFESLRTTFPELAARFQRELGLPTDDSADQLFKSVKDLPSLVRSTDLEKTKLQARWHRYYMGLYEIQGRLKIRREKLDALNPMALKLKRFVLNPFVLVIIIGALVLLVLALIKT